MLLRHGHEVDRRMQINVRYGHCEIFMAAPVKCDVVPAGKLRHKFVGVSAFISERAILVGNQVVKVHETYAVVDVFGGEELI